jgi:hypothetical protein
VYSWESDEKGAITFDLTIPAHTPPDVDVYIQLDPYGWTTPLPMNEIAENQWVFILYSPFNILSDIYYRYCRDGQCGLAGSSGDLVSSQTSNLVTPRNESQYISDQIESWEWLEKTELADPLPLPAINPREDGFLRGVEIMPTNQAGDVYQISSTISTIATSHSGLIILTPTWTFTHQEPPVIEPDPNHDPLWYDLDELTRNATQNGLDVALHPQPQFLGDPEDWWISAPRTFSWWNSWFDQYREYATHFAEAAERQGTEVFIVGGDWLYPALPGGKLANGEPSGVPADAELRWAEILSDIRSRYSGSIAWSMSLPNDQYRPGYLKQIDQIFLNWNPSLDVDSFPDMEVLTSLTMNSLENEIFPFWSTWLEPEGTKLVVNIAYPSVVGWQFECSDASYLICNDLDRFNTPAPRIDEVDTGFAEQAAAYQAMLTAASSKEWIAGIVSRGYFAQTILQDKSISIHGKPAEELLWRWFEALE